MQRLNDYVEERNEQWRKRWSDKVNLFDRITLQKLVYVEKLKAILARERIQLA